MGVALGAAAAAIPLRAAGGTRSLVALYFSAGFDAQGLLPASGPSPLLTNLYGLYESHALAIIASVMDSSNSVRYLVPGTLAHNISEAFSTTATTYTFQGCVTMVPLAGQTMQGPVQDNPGFTQATGLATVFPDTPLGRHLGIVAGLIAGQNGAAAYTVLSSNFNLANTDPDYVSARMSELDGALGAFYAALVETGHAQDVTLFSDVAQLPGRGLNASTRLLLGGAVLSQALSQATRGQLEATLANWAGISLGDLNQIYGLPPRGVLGIL